MSSQKYLLLWDGDCGFCKWTSNWLAARDKFNRLEFSPYQTASVKEEVKVRSMKSIALIHPDGKVEYAGKAALTVWGLLGHKFSATALRIPPLIWCVELGYFLVARNRQIISRLLFRNNPDAQCSIESRPRPGEKS